MSRPDRDPPLGDYTTDRRVLLVALLAGVVASAAVLAGLALLDLIRLAGNIAYLGRFTTADLPLARSPLGLAVVALPVAGGLVVGLMARYGSPKIRGHGIPEAIEAILLGRSRLDARVAILKPLSSAIAIGTGGPFGAEGPIIMTGGAIGSLIAQALPVSDSERKTLLVAGAAAGMTTVFGTPVAAVLLAVELLLFEWSPRSFIPVVLAALVAEAERTLLHMPAPIFPFDATMTTTPAHLVAWIAAGLASGLLAALLTRLVYACEDGFARLPIHWMWWPAIGGLVVGLGGLIEPHALGVGYDNITRMLAGEPLASAALLLLVVKGLIWAVALGSGTSGGVLAPLLIMGGAFGTVAAGALPAAPAGFWALLAMAATMSGAMRAPLTATFFAAEVTGDGAALVPLLAACASAHLVTVLLMKRSILTEKIARRGHHMVSEYRADPFVLARVDKVMTRDVDTVPSTMTLHAAARHLLAPTTRHPSFPVLAPDGRVLGIVNPPAIIAWRRSGRPRTATLGDLLADRPPLVAFADERLEAVADRLARANAAGLPVVSRQDGSLLGYLGFRDLLRVRENARAEEAERTAFIARSATPRQG